MPGFGAPFVAFALFFFSFTTLLAYYFIAEQNLAYLRGHFKLKMGDFPLKVIVMVATFYGTVRAAELAWGLGDIGVGLMAWLNIIAILIIFVKSKPSLLALKDYEEQQKAGVKDYSFDPKKLGIEKATFWENK